MTNNGTIVNNGTLSIRYSSYNNGIIENNSNFENYGARIENRGTINNNGYFINHEGSTVINFGTIANLSEMMEIGVEDGEPFENFKRDILLIMKKL